jgi:hypothetical protein
LIAKTFPETLLGKFHELDSLLSKLEQIRMKELAEET